MASDLKCTVAELMQKPELRKQINLQSYVTEQVGLPTLTDIMAELAKPGRDPRDQFEVVEFADGINTIADLQVGMKLNGIVTNITNFGAFIDVGVHQDGLVHISAITNRFIKSPHEVLKVHQKVLVTVKEVDVARKRISFSMLEEVEAMPKSKKEENPSRIEKFKKAKPQVSNDKSSNKPKPNKPQNQKPKEEPQDDFQAKLEALRNKFK
jgi:uncharacterized protein